MNERCIDELGKRRDALPRVQVMRKHDPPKVSRFAACITSTKHYWRVIYACYYAAIAKIVLAVRS